MSAAEQEAFALKLHAMLAEQVRRYHKRYHKIESTSIPTETAQELIHSLLFTLHVAGGYRPNLPLEDQLQAGQAKLDAALEAARATHALLLTTAPAYQSEWRWDALNALGRYLSRYDTALFAHVSPEPPVYPLLISIPEALEGIFCAQPYLSALFAEEQILDALTGAQALFDLAPPLYWDAPQSIAEQPLCNALAKTLLNAPLEPLALSHAERHALLAIFANGDVAQLLQSALCALAERLGFTDAMREYAIGAVRLLSAHLSDGATMDALSRCFW